MNQALEGIRVIDLTAHLAGPFCTMQLADLGAEVIKIEPPRGDLSRIRVASETKGQAPYFLSVNRNKKGMVLNLKTNEALNIFYELVKISDIVVENYRPRVTEKLLIDYDTLKKINPKIVYASISGFGKTGPYRNRPSFDFIAQSMGGMMHLSGRGGPPVSAAGSIGDTIPALFATVAILAAMHYARKTGCGQYIDVSQVHSVTASMPIPVQTYLITNKEEEGAETKFPMQILRGIYQTKDGYIAIAALYQFVEVFVKIVGKDLPELLDEWTNNMALSKEANDKIVKWILNKTNKELASILEIAKVPFGLVLNISDIVSDPQAIARGMFIEVEHPLGFIYKTVSSPIIMSKTPAIIWKAPPTFGQDTDEILSTLLGYSSEDIANLKKENVII